MRSRETLHLPGSALVRLLAICGAVSLLLLIGSGLVQAYREPLQQSGLGYIAFQVSLTGERTVAVWFASLLLALVSATAVLCYLAERRQTSNHRLGRSWPWLVIAAAFAAFSLDEAGSVHERLGQLGELNPVPDSRSWAGVVAIPLIVCGVGMLVFGWKRLRHHPLVFGLVLMGTALFASVPLQEEIEQRQSPPQIADAAPGDPEHRRPWYMALLEEGAELGGSLAFLAAGLIYAHRLTAPQQRRGIGEISVPLTPSELKRAARGGTIALGAGLVAAGVMHFVWPPLPWRGTPVAWFPAIEALAAAIATWLVVRAQPRSSPWLLLALGCLFWSTEQGAGFLLTDNLWQGSPRMQAAVSGLLALTTAGVTLYLVRSPVGSLIRARVTIWGVLCTLAALAAHPVLIATLIFVAHATLLTAVLELHHERVRA